MLSSNPSFSYLETSAVQQTPTSTNLPGFQEDAKRNANQEFYKDMLRFQRTFLTHKQPEVFSPKKPALEISGVEPIDVFKTRDVPRKLAPVRAIELP